MYVTERNKEQNKSRRFQSVNTVCPLRCAMPTAAGRGRWRGTAGRGRSMAAPSLPGAMVAQAPRGGGGKMAPSANSQAVFDLGTSAGSRQELGKRDRCDGNAELQRSNIPRRAHRLCSIPDRSPQSPSGREKGRKEGGTHPQPGLG